MLYRTLLLLTLLLTTTAYAQSEKLIFALDVIRHGDRTPIHDVPKAPHNWRVGLGQLTPIGMAQEYKNGLAWRQRYIKQTHLLPINYDNHLMLVRSTDYDRTLMSAESALMGLYPLTTGPKLPNSNKAALPAAYQTIPIHTIPVKQDAALVPDNNPEKSFSAYQQYIAPRQDWQQKTAELQAQFPRWSKLTGMNITNLRQLIALGDTLYIRQLYNVPPPHGITKQDEKTIIEAGRWAMATTYKPEQIGTMDGHDLLTTIADYLQQASQHKTDLKFVLFSAHDSTILSLMSAMHVPLNTPPRYASDLNFSLYAVGTENYIVKITLNGKPISIPACGGEVCEISQFTA